MANWKNDQLKPDDLVEIHELDPSIKTEIYYSTINNFTKIKIYNSPKCYVREEVGKALVKVQKELKKSDLGLKIWDAYRPFSAQEKLWSFYPDEAFLAKPIRENNKLISGSKHSRGAAVDLTIVDKNGNNLEMPTIFDDFSEKAKRPYRGLDQQIKRNVLLLEDIMVRFNFIPLPNEWWHFDWKDWQKFELIDFLF